MGVNLPSPYFLSQFVPPPYFLFPHPAPSSSILPTPNFSFSPSSQLFLSHFSLLPILFLHPLYAPRLECNAIPRLVYADFTSSERLSVRGSLLGSKTYNTFVILILRKVFACPLGKLSTEFTSPIAKSSSPGLSDTTFFARWI